MAFIVKSDGVNIVNGDKKEIHVDIDSRRNKNKQVQALLIKDGEKYFMEDPLTKFIKKLNKNHHSIFELLKKEKDESLMVQGHVEKVEKVKRGKRDKGISKNIFEHDLPSNTTRKKKRKKKSKKRAILKTGQLLKK